MPANQTLSRSEESSSLQHVHSVRAAEWLQFHLLPSLVGQHSDHLKNHPELLQMEHPVLTEAIPTDEAAKQRQRCCLGVLQSAEATRCVTGAHVCSLINL